MIPLAPKFHTEKIGALRATLYGPWKGAAACGVFLLFITVGGQDDPVPEPATPQSAIQLQPLTKSDLPWWERERLSHHIETRLPQYQRQFQVVARAYGIPWTLLAAQAYQESRWDPHAVSPTGVRGIMMLTRNTAASLGIHNRLDPNKSIEGGARYFRMLEKQLPRHIRKPDRIWIALAAYNVGMGHIKDAQALARRMGKNPNDWNDLKTVLPLLSEKKYYKTLRYGYARGWEPVQYVTRIRAYHAFLEQFLREI